MPWFCATIIMESFEFLLPDGDVGRESIYDSHILIFQQQKAEDRKARDVPHLTICVIIDKPV